MILTNDRELVASWSRAQLESQYVRVAMLALAAREAKVIVETVPEPELDLTPLDNVVWEETLPTPSDADVIANYEIALDLVVERARHVVAAFGSKSKRARGVRVARARELRLAIEKLDVAQGQLDQLEESTDEG
jgi:hypothetical protein